MEYTITKQVRKKNNSKVIARARKINWPIH